MFAIATLLPAPELIAIVRRGSDTFVGADRIGPRASADPPIPGGTLV
jgi:hypothetical protein